MDIENLQHEELENTNQEETVETTEASPEELSASELGDFESVEIEEVEFIETEQLYSVIESVLFSTEKPVSLSTFKQIFKGTNIKTDRLKKALDEYAVELAGACRGVTLEQVTGGYQLRTKVDNMDFLKRMVKARPFKLSGPALEVLAIVAYKQPVVKMEVDEIRGVESGHLLRSLMERGLVKFEGKSELPGKPMQYGSTKKFLEIFGLRNLQELPTLSEIDELIPEGILEEEGEKQKLSDLTESLSEEFSGDYSQGEQELENITGQLQEISTSSDFFEQEKERQKQKREAERAQDIRDRVALEEEVSDKDLRWLARYDEAHAEIAEAIEVSSVEVVEAIEASPVEMAEAIEAFEADTDQPVDVDGQVDEQELRGEECPSQIEVD